MFVVLVIPNRHIDIFSTKVHILFLEEELEFISVLVKIIVMPEKLSFSDHYKTKYTKYAWFYSLARRTNPPWTKTHFSSNAKITFLGANGKYS